MANNLTLPSRDVLEERGRRAWELRHRLSTGRNVKVGPGSLPNVAIQMAATLVLPMFANAARYARRILVRGNTGDTLDALAQEHGVDGHRPATGSDGFVVAKSIAATGSKIFQGDQLTDDVTSLVFEVSTTSVYNDGDPIPIDAVSTGPSTNLAGGRILTFTNPRPGCSNTASVQPQNDGTGNLVGLFGGATAETDADVQDRIIEARANPPGSGNNAELVIAAARTGGVPVERAYAIPAWYGPGNTAIVFTLRPNAATGSRIPNTVHIGKVQTAVEGLFPTDFRITVCWLLAVTVNVIVNVTWRSGATGWTNGGNAWPTSGNGTSQPIVDAAVTPTSTAMRVTSAAVMSAPPQPGQTIALYEKTSSTFWKKRILTATVVSPTHSWDLTFDTTNGASDPYIPIVGQIVSPWSDALNLIPPAMASVFKKLGPGEQFAVFKDPGLGQRRWPPSPDTWPSALTNVDMITALKGTLAISDADVVTPVTPYATPVGVPGVRSYLLQLGDLAVYPQ